MSQAQHQFLVELGTEELPPTALLGLSKAFADSIEKALRGLEVGFTSVEPFASPRRLAVRVNGLQSTTPVKEVTVWGPPAKVAFDQEGQPTKAAQAFAKKNNIAIDQLQTANDGKADKLCVSKSEGGEDLTSLLPEIVQRALDSLPINKRMRWGASRDEFVRPVHWLVMMFDQQVIPCSLFGLQAGNQTWGHRFHANQPLPLSHPSDYASLLNEKGSVIADFEARQQLIREQVLAAGEALGGRAVVEDGLLEEVTALVEWPVALSGAFESRFLDVPAEALISSMKEHQKYFHVVDAEGNLLPHFITVANLVSTHPEEVVAGNEKVIRPRLSDAAFFFETDKKQALEQHREKLKSVVFQAKLGSVFDKTERVAKLSGWIAAQLGEDVALAQRAAQLSKADLATNMVYEFADMQGIAGEYYARHSGEPEAVAKALSEQYLPKFAGDELPATKTGTILALADRLDTLAGIFGIGQVPTGSKDPFALRRASLAVLRILVEQQLDLDLQDLLTQAAENYSSLPNAEESTQVALTYMLERFKSWYEEREIPSAVYQSVAARNVTCPLDIDMRVRAVFAFYQLPQAEALAAANKRVSNILAKFDGNIADAIQADLLNDSAEKDLAQQVAELKNEIVPLFQQREYESGLTRLASLRETVDTFFDDVMVMCDDEALKANRIALLDQLRKLFWEVADISQLAVSR